MTGSSTGCCGGNCSCNGNCSCGGNCSCKGGADDSRRDFLLMGACTLGAVGVGSVAWPLIDSMNPAADVLAMATTEVDLSSIKEGEAKTVIWQGKPVFIRHRTAKEIDDARSAPMSDLKDPQKDEDRVAQSKFGGKDLPQWLIVNGTCTHLGCIPQGQKPTEMHGEFGGWFCPCHGSQYDTSGRIRKGPAPKNLEVPPYQFVEAAKIRIG